MKRKDSVEAEASSAVKKQAVISADRLETDGVDNQMAIVLYSGGGEPVAHRKKKSCKPSKPKFENGMAISGSGGDHKKKKACKPREKIGNGPNPAPGIPTGFKDMIEQMGGTDLRMIIQKGLTETDLSRSHSRLSMPSTLWFSVGLQSSEFLMMLENNGNNNVSLPMIDASLKVWESVSLRMWKMAKTKTLLVIAGEWNNVAAANALKVKDVVQIWCFKFAETGGYGLAMVKIESDNNINNVNTDDISLSLSLLPNSDGCCNVTDVPRIQSHMSNSATHCSSFASNQYSSTTYFDFLSIKSSDAMFLTHQVPDSEYSSVMVPINNGSDTGLTEVTGAESALLNVSDISSSDNDLDLHL